MGKKRREKAREGEDTDSSNRFLGSPVCFLAAESSLSRFECRGSNVEVRGSSSGSGSGFGKGLRGMAMLIAIAIPLRDSPSHPISSRFEPIQSCG